MPVNKNINWKRISALALILFHFGVKAQINCENDTSYKTPIVDLLTGYYLGFQGGLYPGGTNIMPAAHADSGIAIANAMLPVNFDGDADTTYGKTILLGLGAASAGRCFNKFSGVYADEGISDSCFRIINGCMEDAGLDSMIGPTSADNYWKEINDIIQGEGLKKKQVQVVWLMSPSFDDTIITQPQYIDSLTEKYVAVIRKLKSEFVNLKLLYISGLQYGGYFDTLSEHRNALAEPAPYLNDFAIKAAIERQINGDTLLRYSGLDAPAPWVAWGPNYWADGRNLRDDGLRWICPSDYDEALDGFSLSSGGQQKIADRLFTFFSTEPTTTPWFFGLPYDCFTEPDVDETDSIQSPDDEVVWIAPNPVKGTLKFVINITTNDKADVVVFNALGEKIVEGAFYKIEDGKIFTIKMTGNQKGIYILSVLVEGKVYNVPFFLDQ